ncbi:MAG: hypothetical protein ACQXXH_01485 [Candidatus Bathyarchaeia archaeon]|jgi:hypothetical protein|nr:hypothetical protein [Candidatus Bathyarchaeota archaeon A05DMB-4]MDH7596093.1 hypothetical protein [Candidatus Bathyarchaeota archaeon]
MRIDKPEISGLITLFIGVGLLVFTFLNAYWFLAKDITIVASQDLVRAFGEALAPLVATCIHIMYLGVMGWIGSLLTLRGIPLLTHSKPVTVQPQTTQAIASTPAPQKQTQKEKPKQPEKAEKPPEKPQPQPAKPETKPKEEPKKEPEVTIEVRPPEEVTVETPPSAQPDAKQPPPPQP